MTFEAWNRTLLRHFFNGSRCNEYVVLTVNRDELDLFTSERDLDGYDGLLRSVRAGPAWARGCSLEALACRLKQYREFPDGRPASYQDPSITLGYGSLDEKFPPYLPILAALVALYSENEHGEGGFYKAAQEALKLPTNWGPAQMAPVNDLWHDLQVWTKCTQGRYGLFMDATAGDHPNVGRLRAQAVLRPSDRSRLVECFHKLGLDADDRLGDDKIEVLRAELRGAHFSLGARCAAEQADPGDRYRAVLKDLLVNLLSEAPAAPPATQDRDLDRSHALLIGLVVQGTSLSQIVLHADLAGVDGNASVAHDGVQWSGVCRERGLTPLRPMPGNGLEVLAVARQPNSRKAPLEGTVNGEQQKFRLRHYGVSYLTWDPSAAQDTLLQRYVRTLHADLFMLVSDDAAPTLERQLRDTPAQRLQLSGLPEGWSLWHIKDPSKIAGISLPDGNPGDAKPARSMRLVGGTCIRGGGRKYLAYDLPRLELDAPEGVMPASEGLRFTRVGSGSEATTASGAPTCSLRLFEIEVLDDRLLFMITAGTERLQLRIQPPDAHLQHDIKHSGSESPGQAASCGLAPDGCCVELRVPGQEVALLTGMHVTDAASRAQPEPTAVAYPASKIGECMRPEALSDLMKKNPSARLLDWLRREGRLTWSRARERLERWIDEAQAGIAPSELVADLSVRGHLELLNDSRQHWAYLMTVPRGRYALHAGVDNTPLRTPCGTLSLMQWAEEAEEGQAYVEGMDGPFLPVVRALSMGDLGNVAISAAGHSLSLQDIRNRYHMHGMSQAPTVRHRWHWPLQGWWREGRPPHPQYPQDPQGLHWSSLLCKYDDPNMDGRKVRLLLTSHEGQCRYRNASFDKWAMWLVYTDLACQLQTTWPLPYSEASGSVWLPSDMDLPPVLQRALVSCSGALRRWPNIQIPGMHDAYRCFTERPWSEYRWVPRVVAEAVASKLGCTLWPHA